MAAKGQKGHCINPFRFAYINHMHNSGHITRLISRSILSLSSPLKVLGSRNLRISLSEKAAEHPEPSKQSRSVLT